MKIIETDVQQNESLLKKIILLDYLSKLETKKYTTTLNYLLIKVLLFEWVKILGYLFQLFIETMFLFEIKRSPKI